MSLYKEETTSLSTDQIKNIMLKSCNKNIKIILLDSIKSSDTIDNIFGPNKEIIIYSPVLSMYNGHFQTAFISNNQLFFFDSYGNTPSYLIKLVNSQGNIKDSNNLYKIFQNSGMPSFMNTIDYQSETDENIADCGRYSTAVLIFKNQCEKNNIPFDLKTFYDILTSLKKKYGCKTYDETVTIFTQQFL